MDSENCNANSDEVDVFCDALDSAAAVDLGQLDAEKSARIRDAVVTEFVARRSRSEKFRRWRNGGFLMAAGIVVGLFLAFGLRPGAEPQIKVSEARVFLQQGQALFGEGLEAVVIDRHGDEFFWIVDADAKPNILSGSRLDPQAFLVANGGVTIICFSGRPFRSPADNSQIELLERFDGSCVLISDDGVEEVSQVLRL